MASSVCFIICKIYIGIFFHFLNGSTGVLSSLLLAWACLSSVRRPSGYFFAVVGIVIVPWLGWRSPSYYLSCWHSMGQVVIPTVLVIYAISCRSGLFCSWKHSESSLCPLLSRCCWYLAFNWMASCWWHCSRHFLISFLSLIRFCYLVFGEFRVSSGESLLNLSNHEEDKA